MTEIEPQEFLSEIWPKKLLTNETLELRAIDRKTKNIHRSFLTSVSQFLREASNHKDKEIYFGVATRLGHGGKKHNCYRICAVWADLDGVRLKDVDFDPAPTFTVISGGGVHCYWKLESPVLINNGNGRLAEIESINRGLCARFKGDHMCTDVTHILRAPGFLNHKYNPFRPVKAFKV